MVVVALVVSHFITITRTCSVVIVVVTWTAAVVSVAVSVVLLKVVLLSGGGTMSARPFYFEEVRWCQHFVSLWWSY